jgi:hypothetical protein
MCKVRHTGRISEQARLGIPGRGRLSGVGFGVDLVDSRARKDECTCAEPVAFHVPALKARLGTASLGVGVDGDLGGFTLSSPSLTAVRVLVRVR